MSEQTNKINLFEKLEGKLAKAHETHRARPVEETDFGARLPAGIENGIAQFRGFRYGKYKSGDNEGQDFIYLWGATVAPADYEGVPIKGIQTSKTLPLCDTKDHEGKPVSIGENYAKVLQTVKALGANVAATTTPRQVHTLLELLKKAKPYFRFRTWKGDKTPKYPNPKTNEVWMGKVDYKPTAQDDGVIEEVVATSKDGDGEATETPKVKAGKVETPKVESPKVAGNGTPSTNVAKTSTKKPAKPKQPEPEPEPAFDDGAVDLQALADEADGGDDDAAMRLREIAAQAGVDEEQIDEAADYQEVKRLIEEAQEAPVGLNQAVVDEEEEEVEDEEDDDDDDDAEVTEPAFTPQLKQIYDYRPLDAKKKPAKQAVKCMVIAVDAAAETVELRNMTDKKIRYPDVPWASLTGE